MNSLAGIAQFPVAFLRFRKKVTQRFDAITVGLEHFSDQVTSKIHIALAHRQHRLEVGCANRAEQVKDGALLEKTGGKAGKGAKQQSRFTVDNAGIQMRDRHGGRTNGCLAIYLGVMLLYHIGLAAHQPLTANGEAPITAGLVNTGFLQQRQCPAARSEEHKSGFQFGLLTCVLVFHPNFPATIIALIYVMHRAPQHQLKVGLALQILDQIPGQRTKIHI